MGPTSVKPLPNDVTSYVIRPRPWTIDRSRFHLALWAPINTRHVEEQKSASHVRPYWVSRKPDCHYVRTDNCHDRNDQGGSDLDSAPPPSARSPHLAHFHVHDGPQLRPLRAAAASCGPRTPMAHWASLRVDTVGRRSAPTRHKN